MPAKVSLLIPAYNREPFIAAAVGSALRQTYENFELLVWDDGSTDATADVAERAIANDPRAKVVRAAHAGLCPSINAAAKQLTEKYFGWVDSDDAIAPTALAETVQFLDAHPDVGMVYTDYLTMDESGRVGGLGSRTKIPYSKDRLLIDFMTFHFRLIRRSVFDAAGMLDETTEAAEDYERRFFGAAQFQVLIPVSQVPRPEDRDKIFQGLIRSRPELIENLISDGLSQ